MSDKGAFYLPMLFNMCSENIFREALEDEPTGIVINGKNIYNIRYADDTVLIASSLEDVQRLVNKVAKASKEYGLHININKTKWMLVTKRK